MKKALKSTAPSYLLKIKLCDIKPTVWRRFVVPADVTLDVLHEIIQVVMGWENYHLHRFSIDGRNYMPGEACEDTGGLPESEHMLVQVAQQKGAKLHYEYDLGDCWEHEITVESTDYSDPYWQYPVYCIAGAMACPPEDSGGCGGYENVCEVLADKNHPEHQLIVRWLGDDYDRTSWDIDEVNKVFGIDPNKTAKKAVKKAVKKTTQ